MPQIKNISTRSGTVGVWKITESEPFFTQRLRLKHLDDLLNRPMCKRRKLEWLASRYLLQKLLNDPAEFDIQKNQNGKPFLNQKQHISFSHSDRLVAAALSQQNTALDIQVSTPKFLPLAFKFISAKEEKYISTTHRQKHIQLIWGAKETVYKIYGTPALFFKRDIAIQPFSLKSSGTIFANTWHSRCQRVLQLQYEWIGQHALIYIV